MVFVDRASALQSCTPELRENSKPVLQKKTVTKLFPLLFSSLHIVDILLDKTPKMTQTSETTRLLHQVSNPSTQNGWIKSIVDRKGKAFTMSLQGTTMNHPIFAGVKQGNNKYMLHKMNGEILGFLEKTPRNGETVGYALYQEKRGKNQSESHMEALTIRYDIPSIAQTIVEAQPRRATISVSGKETLRTKEPYMKEKGRRGLDFHGRGRIASRKNMQLEDQDGRVALQMAKWDKNQFHLDFAYPFDSFDAFGFALAQFDL